MSETNIIQIAFDPISQQVSVVFDIWIALAAVTILALVTAGLRLLHGRGSVFREVVPVSFTYSAGGAEIQYQIVRDFANVEIAHRVYIELVTRKAAIPLEEERDVIVEVYDSWYSLFRTVRDELKRIPGQVLRSNKRSADLISLLTDLLNLGLRPHLTEYQALFRKWYAERLEDPSTKGQTPQEIQRSYGRYSELTSSMKQVNAMLIKYAAGLKQIVDGT